MKIKETSEIKIEKSSPNIVVRAIRMYVDGFRNLSPWARSLWILLAVKLIVMFAVLKVFFFPNYIGQYADTTEAKSEFVSGQLIERAVE